MDYGLIINVMFNYGSILLTALAVLVFATTIVVEVVKGLFPKIPTNFVAVVVAEVLTVLAVLALCAIMEIAVMWYYMVGAVELGLFTGYASMFGFDKFKTAFEKLKRIKNET